jgi:hypothetical protein
MPMKSAQLTCPRSKSTNFATETRLAPVRRPRGQDEADDEHRHGSAGDNAPATRYSQNVDWLAIIRDLGWACAIALLIAIAGNYVAALL